MTAVAEALDDIGVIRLEPGGTIATWNRGAELIYGFSADQVAGRPVAILYADEPVTSGLPEDDLERALTGGRIQVERWHRRPDGGAFRVRMTLVALRDLTGRHEGFVLFARTPSASAPAEPRPSSLYVFDHAVDPIVMWNLSGSIIAWNRGAENLYGFTAAEAIGQVAHRLLETEFPADLAACEAALRGRGAWAGELRQRTKDGRTVIVDSRMVVVDLPGRAPRVLEVDRDLTGRKRAEESLRDELVRARVVANQAPDAIIVTDSRGAVSTMNSEAERMFGFTAAELAGKDLHDALHHHRPDGEVRSRRDCRLLRAAALGETVRDHEDVFFHRDGTPIPVLCSRSPLEVDGEPFGGVVILHDLTHRKRAEAVFREDRERLALALASSGTGVWEWRADSNDVIWSDECYRIFGVRAFGGDRGAVARMIHPEDVGDMWYAFYSAIAHGRYAAKLRIVRPDGEIRWIESVGQVSHGEDGRPLRLVGTVQDVTERREAEQRLRQSEARMRLLAESVPTLIWTCEPDGACDYVSPQYVAYTGFPAERHHGGGWIETVHPDDRARLARVWDASVASGADFHAEFRLRRQDGAYRWFESRATALRDPAGKTQKWLGSNVDIHDRQELGQALKLEEKRLSAIVESASGVVHSYRIRPDGAATFSYAGPGIEAIYGLKPDQLREDASAIWSRVHPVDRERVRASAARSLRTLSPWRAEFRVLHPERGEIWVEGRSKPAREPDGSVVWTGFLEDVTERKRLDADLARAAKREAALRKSEECFARAFLQSPVGMILFDWSTGRIVEVNDAYLTARGSGRLELVGGMVSAELRAFRDRSDPPLAPDGIDSTRPVTALAVAFVRRDGAPAGGILSIETFEVSHERFGLLVLEAVDRSPAAR